MNSTALLFGGVAVVVVIVLIVVMSGRGDATGAGTGTDAAKAASPAPAPAAPASAASGTTTFGAKAGKPPARTAPPLPQAVLDQSRTLLAEAKVLSNEGVTLRNAGNNQEARAKQSAASDKIEEIKRLTEVHWAWQEEAELGDWALAPEYSNLGDLYSQLTKLDNQIRKGGGTR